jgi:hypothetical protein
VSRSLWAAEYAVRDVHIKADFLSLSCSGSRQTVSVHSACSGLVACCQGRKYTIYDETTIETFILIDAALIDQSDTNSHVGIVHVVECVSSSLRPSFVVIGRILVPPLSINPSGSAQTEVIDSLLFATLG